MTDRPFFARPWRDLSARGRVVMAAVVVAGVVAYFVLPEPAGAIYTVAMIVAGVVSVWLWHRRRDVGGRRPPTEEWRADRDRDAGEALN